MSPVQVLSFYAIAALLAYKLPTTEKQINGDMKYEI